MCGGRNKKKANLLPPRQDSTTEGETLTRVCCVVSADKATNGTPGTPGPQKNFFGKDIFQLKKKIFFGPGLGPVAPKNAKKRTYEHF